MIIDVTDINTDMDNARDIMMFNDDESCNNNDETMHTNNVVNLTIIRRHPYEYTTHTLMIDEVNRVPFPSLYPLVVYIYMTSWNSARS